MLLRQLNMCMSIVNKIYGSYKGWKHIGLKYDDNLNSPYYFKIEVRLNEVTKK